jgi:hypothetical protein
MKEHDWKWGKKGKLLWWCPSCGIYRSPSRLRWLGAEGEWRDDVPPPCRDIVPPERR